MDCNWEYENYGPAADDFNLTSGDCVANPTVTVTKNITGECHMTGVWTAKYENQCGQKDSVKITYNWTEDNTAPTISDIADQNAVPANANCQYLIPNLKDVTLAATNDDCSGNVTFVSQSETGTVDQTDGAQTIEVTVTVKDACGNEQTKVVNVKVPAKPTVTATAETAAFCLNGSTTLTATPANTIGTVTYSWEPATTLNASNVATVTATPTTADENTYTVTITDGNGCQVSDDVTVTVNPLVTLVTPTNASQAVCLNTPIEGIIIENTNSELSVTGLPAGVSLSGNTISGTPTESGAFTYTVTATSDQDPACESKSFSGTITVYALPTPTLSAQSVCKNSTDFATTLTTSTVSGMNNYVWSVTGGTIVSGQNTNEITTSWNTTGSISVEVTDEHGCTNTAEADVTVYDLPVVTVNDAAICLGQRKPL